jgi:hypothetical protein
MPKLRIDALLANMPVDPHVHLDPDRVARYVGMRDPLPPRRGIRAEEATNRIKHHSAGRWGQAQ